MNVAESPGYAGEGSEFGKTTCSDFGQWAESRSCDGDGCAFRWRRMVHEVEARRCGRSRAESPRQPAARSLEVFVRGHVTATDRRFDCAIASATLNMPGTPGATRIGQARPQKRGCGLMSTLSMTVFNRLLRSDRSAEGRENLNSDPAFPRVWESA